MKYRKYIIAFLSILVLLLVIIVYLISSPNIDMYDLTLLLVLIFAVLIEVVTLTVQLFRNYSDMEEKKAYSEKLERAILPNNIENIYSTTKTKETEQDNSSHSKQQKTNNTTITTNTTDTYLESMDKKETNSIDALRLMMINLENIKEFYRWGQKQAKTSFRLAFIMCIFGFALMAAAIFLPALFQQNLQMAIIPAIGGVITELVAGTVLVVYKSSLAQFNHYHKVLHEDARFLSSINLLDRFSTEKERDEMLKAIITSEIQMNIEELKFTHTNDKQKDKNKQ